MGGIYQTPDGVAAWVGGITLHDWSGLTQNSLQADCSPNQTRSYSVAGEQKAFSYRKKGLDPQFKQTDSLEIFQYQVKAHLEEFGLDTISYLPDPVNPTTMICLVDCHSKFTVASAASASSILCPRFDYWDKQNDKTAAKFLLDSFFSP